MDIDPEKITPQDIVSVNINKILNSFGKKTEKETVMLPKGLLEDINTMVEIGGYSSKSHFIRKAITDELISEIARGYDEDLVEAMPSLKTLRDPHWNVMEYVLEQKDIDYFEEVGLKESLEKKE